MANSIKAISGTGDLRIKGGDISADSIRVAGTIRVKAGTVSRNEVAGVGFGLSRENSYIEAEIYDQCNLSLHSIDSLCGQPGSFVTARLANGKSYTITEPWVAGSSAETSSEGTITLRFESVDPAEEVLSC